MTTSSSSESIAKHGATVIDVNGLEMEVPDIDEGVARLEALGAKVIQPKPAEGWQWVVMIDPEGNEFCVST